MKPGKILALLSSTCATSVLAAPLYQPPGSNLTFGEVTHSQRVLSSANNPAAAAAMLAAGRDSTGGSGRGGAAGSLSIGLEYGNVAELFETIDELSRRFKPTGPGGGGGGPGQKPDEKNPGGIDIGDIIDELFPDLRPALEAVAREVAVQVGILAIVSTEGYARAFVSADVPILIGQDMLGGSWSFGVGWSGMTKTYGVVDQDIDFNLEDALEDLKRQLEEAVSGGIGTDPLVFDVVGDVDFTIDPVTDRIRARFDNDSLLLSKATQQTEISAGYSRQVIDGSRGKLFIGGQASIYNLQLSRISVRLGDITDSEELFKQIRNADFRSDTGLGVDIGVLWSARRYQLGATLTNVNEPDFSYPAVDLSPYSSPRIVQGLLDDQIYTMKRQLRLEGAVFTGNRRWALNFGVDANAVPDPVGDEFQWATVSGSWTTGTRWAPNVRFGYRRNLAGTEISYVNAGLQVFQFFNFDVGTSLNTVSIKGDKLPQGLMLNMGFLFNF